MDDMLEKTTVKKVQLVIEGRVQGVGFRAWTAANARKRGLKGFVRNRKDGTVEAHFSGPSDVVEQMVAACWDGPMVSRVTNVTVRPSQQEMGEGFTSEATI